jgi:hypothetical protein
MSVGDSIELEGRVGAYKVGNLVKVTQPTIDPDALYIIGQVTALDVTGTYEESMTIEVVDFRWSAYGNSIAGSAGRYEVSLCSAPVYGYGFELPPTAASPAGQYFSGLIGTTLNLTGIIGAYKIGDKVKITGWDMFNYGTPATGAYILGTINNLYRNHDTSEGVGVLVEETFANGFNGIYPVVLNIAGQTGTDEFRNLIINGDFGINQRGFSNTTTSGTFGFDRWQISLSGGTVTYSAQTFTPGNAITEYEPTNYARVVTSGHSASTNTALLIHKIEDVRNCAGQTATISFWAQAASGTPKVAVQIIQSFGTGGSPSADVDTYVGQVTLSTSWQRFTLTFNVPSIYEKTIGTTANTSFLRLNLWTSAGSNNNASTGSLGVQNATINFWGVQLEQNSMATPFKQRPIGTELALCQRYYWRTYGTGTSSDIVGAGSANNANNVLIGISHPVPMRIKATSLDFVGRVTEFNSDHLPTSQSIAQSNERSTTVQFNKTSAFTAYIPYFVNLQATTSYIGLSAEF